MPRGWEEVYQNYTFKIFKFQCLHCNSRNTPAQLYFEFTFFCICILYCTVHRKPHKPISYYFLCFFLLSFLVFLSFVFFYLFLSFLSFPSFLFFECVSAEAGDDIDDRRDMRSRWDICFFLFLDFTRNAGPCAAFV